MIGIGLRIGLLRPSVEVPEAEAAEQVTWRCLSPHNLDFYVVAHNPTAGKVVANFSFFSRFGNKLGGGPMELASRQTEGWSLGNNVGLVEVRGPSPILAVGYTRPDHGQIACFKKVG